MAGVLARTGTGCGESSVTTPVRSDAAIPGSHDRMKTRLQGLMLQQ